MKVQFKIGISRYIEKRIYFSGTCDGVVRRVGSRGCVRPVAARRTTGRSDRATRMRRTAGRVFAPIRGGRRTGHDVLAAPGRDDGDEQRAKDGGGGVGEHDGERTIIIIKIICNYYFRVALRE